MGVIIYGRRAYGRVHQHEGEYADTQFAHVDFVPLFPIGSFWVTQDLGNGQRMGFPIKLNGRSVLATYLRIWGPIAATGVLATTHGLTGTIIGLAIAVLSIWSWTWRSRRGDLAHKRSDFDRVALGSRCDPAWMTDDMRDRIANSLENTLAKREDARPPDDVARFGAKDVQEAVLAYGLLRISSLKHRAAGASADRLLASAFEQLPQDGGPYRESIGAAVPEIGAAISAAARAAAARHRLPKPKRWFHNRWLQVVGLLFLSMGAVAMGADKLGPAREATAAQLTGVNPPTSGRVRVHCDRIENDDWRVVQGDGDDVSERITFCWQGTHALPVVTKGDDDLTATTIEGRLRYVDNAGLSEKPWVDALKGDDYLDAHSYEVYLLRRGDERFDLVLAIVWIGLVGLGWFFWIRRLVRDRRAKTA